MSDARWMEVDGDVKSAVRHFSMAVRIHGDGIQDDLDEYRTEMAFMHAMQSGHTSFESAMLRILDMLGEERPSGDSWHMDLVNRVSVSLNDRPAILDCRMKEAADETRAFRNLATRAYDSFSLDRCGPSLAAAQVMVDGLPRAISDFRALVDPPLIESRDRNGRGSGHDG